MKGRTILVAAVLSAAALPACASAQATGELGGPPTMGGHLPFPPPHKRTFLPKATTEPIVIGVGSGPFGRVEIVGQNTKDGLCIFIDHPKQSIQSFSCVPVFVPQVIAADTFTWQTERRRSKSLSELSGFMQPTVASVTAVAHRRKGRKRATKRVPGIAAVPNADLLARLHQTTPFGFFAVNFRGCLEDAKVRFNAFDASGLLLGSSQANLGFPKRFTEALRPCKPGGGIVVFGKATAVTAATAP